MRDDVLWRVRVELPASSSPPRRTYLYDVADHGHVGVEHLYHLADEELAVGRHHEAACDSKHV
jgi:hypothetical protein